MKPAPVSVFSDAEAKSENKTIRHIGISVLLALGLSACASPLWTGDDGSASPGTVPRDENGEPIWDQVKPDTPQ